MTEAKPDAECPQDVTDYDSLLHHFRSLLGNGDGAEDKFYTIKATIHRINRYGLLRFDALAQSQPTVPEGWVLVPSGQGIDVAAPCVNCGAVSRHHTKRPRMIAAALATDSKEGE